MSHEFFQHMFGGVGGKAGQSRHREGPEFHSAVQAYTPEDELLTGVERLVGQFEDMCHRPFAVPQFGEVSAVTAQLPHEVGRGPGLV
ncbi:hypothetical protein, partial [Streptomyces sp. SID13031]|uniref:hypothetical protein n=1 Tax=Streptomyces sp. SID13031 TaxID=2706046 RepID=UPI001942C721